MPAARYTGSPTGEGNPPGKHSEGYLSNGGGTDGHFVGGKAYDVLGGLDRAKVVEVGNQPKEQHSATLESRAYGSAIPGEK